MSAKEGTPTLSILIPTLNEGRRIGTSLEKLADYLKEKKYDAEVIVVDSLSQDKTRTEAERYAKKFATFHFLQTGPNVGKGKQVRDGMFAARGRYVMFMDADLATPLKYIDEVYGLIERDAKVAICVRDLGDTHTGVRKFISGFGNWLAQMLIVPGIKDTQCGFKVFERDVARDIFGRQKIVGWGFDMEVLAIARKQGYPIELIDVPDWKDVADGTFSNSSLKSIRLAIRTFLDLLRIKWGLITGQYNHVRFTYRPYEEEVAA